MTARRWEALALAILIFSPFLWFWPLLTGLIPDFMDTAAYHLPIRMAVARQVGEGTLPLWLPNQFCGAPLAANPQASVWYPPQALMYLWPAPGAFNTLQILHYSAGGAGMFFLVKRLGAGTLAALFAALTFQFGPMLISRLALAIHLQSVIWIPWILWSMEALVRDPRWFPGRKIVISALLFACHVLAGAPQITYYFCLILPLLWMVRAIVSGSDWKLSAAQAVVAGASVAILAAMLSAIQMLPTAEYLAHAERSEIPLQRQADSALNGGYLWRALIGFSGDQLEDTDSINAVGFAVMALAGIALLRRRKRGIAIPYFAVGLFVYLLSIGALVPLWRSLIPLYDGFNAPRRALVLWSVMGPLLGGLGFQIVQNYARLKSWPQQAVPAIFLVGITGTVWILPRVERQFTDPARFEPIPGTMTILGDDRYLSVDSSLRYSHGIRRVDFGESMLPNMAAWHGLYDVQGYDPLLPKRIGLARFAAATRTRPIYSSHGVFFPDPDAKVLRLMNINYLVGDFDGIFPEAVPVAAREETELVRDHPRWPLYQYKEERPFAWIPETVRPAPDPQTAIRAVYQDRFQALASVEEPLEIAPISDPPAVSGAWLDDRTIEIALSQPLAQPALLVVSSTWMPGWAVNHPDGSVQNCIPAYGFLTACLLPAGAEGAVLRYSPVSFWRGFLLTLVGLLACTIVWFRESSATK